MANKELTQTLDKGTGTIAVNKSFTHRLRTGFNVVFVTTEIGHLSRAVER